MSSYNRDASLTRRIDQLERRLRTIETANPLRNASITGAPGLRIGGGGGVLVEGGGDVSVSDGGSVRVTGDGDIVIDGGRLVVRLNNIDVVMFGDIYGDDSLAGWVLRRGDGSWAGSLVGATFGDDTEIQTWNWSDGAGDGLVADDGVAGNALARPYIGESFGVSVPEYWPHTTSSTYVDAWLGFITRVNPRLNILIQTLGDSGGEGTARLMVDGTAWGSAVAIDANAFGFYYLGGLWPVGSNHSQHLVTIQFRRTNGTGSVRVSCHGAQGGQS